MIYGGPSWRRFGFFFFFLTTLLLPVASFSSIADIHSRRWLHHLREVSKTAFQSRHYCNNNQFGWNRLESTKIIWSKHWKNVLVSMIRSVKHLDVSGLGSPSYFSHVFVCQEANNVRIKGYEAYCRWMNQRYKINACWRWTSCITNRQGVDWAVYIQLWRVACEMQLVFVQSALKWKCGLVI